MLLRAYARALLLRESEADEAARRHFDHYAGLHGDYDANNDEDRHPKITPDFEQLRAALDWGFAQEPERACRLAVALYYYMMLRQPVASQRALLEHARAAAQGVGDTWDEAQATFLLGDVSRLLDEYDNARHSFQKAADLYKQVGDHLGQANALKGLGDVSFMQGDNDTARQAYQKATTLSHQVGDRRGQANAFKGLGDVSRVQGKYDTASEAYHKAAALYGQIGDRLGQANALQGLGRVHHALGQYDDGRSFLRRILDDYHQLGSVRSEMSAHVYLAYLEKDAGDMPTACAHYNTFRVLYDAHPQYATVGFYTYAIAQFAGVCGGS
jgi:tetratricopeptide (TPR) repeat protein